MTAQTVFDRCATRLLRIYPFWGSLLLGMDVKPAKDTSTMATDGVTLFYNPDYVLNQNETIVCTDQAHEAAHRMFRDHLRRKHRDPRLWNIACDYRINLYLRDCGLKIGDDYLIDDRFVGMDAEAIYDLLMQNPNDPANQQAGCGCGGLRDHPSKGGNSPGTSAAGVDFGEAEILAAIAQALAFAKGAGDLPGSLREAIGEQLNPAVRWYQILQRFMEYCDQDDFSWIVPDRRFLYLDMYLPGIESEGIDEFVIAIDTSGSTTVYMSEFLGHVNRISASLKFNKIHVLYCDAKVQHVDEYSHSDLPIKADHTYGGGGTDMQPVFAWLEERSITPKGMVYFTDTYGTYPQGAPSYPVMWVAPKGCNPSVPWGELIQIS